MTVHAYPDEYLPLDQRIAMNLFWRDGAYPMIVIARAFGVSKNTMYYRCLTGKASSYPQTDCNTAALTNEIVNKMGPENARKKFVTQEMIAAVEAEAAANMERKKQVRLKKRNVTRRGN